MWAENQLLRLLPKYSGRQRAILKVQIYGDHKGNRKTELLHFSDLNQRLIFGIVIIIPLRWLVKIRFLWEAMKASLMSMKLRHHQSNSASEAPSLLECQTYWGGPFLRACFSYVLRTKKGPLLSHIVSLQFPYWGGPPLGVQILYTFPTPKTGIEQIEQFNDIILRISLFLAESSGVTKLELFQFFPL